MHKENINLLFVCLGNICRSPAAEGIMKKMIEDEGLKTECLLTLLAHPIGTKVKHPMNACVCMARKEDTIFALLLVHSDLPILKSLTTSL